jgi:hypothetical protein
MLLDNVFISSSVGDDGTREVGEKYGNSAAYTAASDEVEGCGDETGVVGTLPCRLVVLW